MSQTDLINHSGTDVDNPRAEHASMGLDEMEEYILYGQLIRENIQYDLLCSRNPYEKDIINEMVSLMTDVVSVKRETVRINKTDYPHGVVKSVFLKLKLQHMEFVLYSLSNKPAKVGNIRNYLLTLLYNAFSTCNNEASAYVNYRRCEEGRENQR